MGQTVTGVIDTTVSDCVEEPGWPCQYFRLTAPSDGVLTIELRYEPETQPPGRFGVQEVDVTLEDVPGTKTWAQFTDHRGVVRASGNVKALDEYQITLWYAFPGLVFELRTTLNR